MTREFLYNFISRQTLLSLATISGDKPEAALVGFAITEDLEIIFDTIKSSRKYKNLTQNTRIAAVIGWDDETTVQYEGLATELQKKGDDCYKEKYYNVFPDGRQRAQTWPGLVHFKIAPRWIRYSNFNEPAVVEEMFFRHA